MIAIACGLYLLAALFASRLGRKEIGPLEHEMTKEIHGFAEMAAGFKTLRGHTDALRGIFTTGIQRGGLTALTLMALLLQRNTFNPSNNPDAGLRGFALTMAIAGVGVGVGAILSPIGVAKFGRHVWIKISLIAPIAGIAPELTNFTYMIVSLLFQYDYIRIRNFNIRNKVQHILYR